MSVRVFGPEHWREANRRRAEQTRRAHLAQMEAQRQTSRRPTLDEIMRWGPWCPPYSGDAA